MHCGVLALGVIVQLSSRLAVCFLVLEMLVPVLLVLWLLVPVLLVLGLDFLDRVMGPRCHPLLCAARLES